MTEPATKERQYAALIRVALLFAASLLAIWWPKLSPATGFLALPAGLAMPRLSGRVRGWTWSLLVMAALASCAGFALFVINEAIPGVLAGGKAAVSKHTVAFLRTVITAQDKLRQHAELDHDGDGIGSAMLLSEMSGLRPPRGGGRLRQIPLLLTAEQVGSSADGEVVVQGAFLVKVCLPTPTGDFTAVPGTLVDEEAAEREYKVFAWPRGVDPGAPGESYFLDAQERILVQMGEPTRYVGTTLGPKCDTVPASADGWVPWKEKTARAGLPGDTSRLQAD